MIFEIIKKYRKFRYWYNTIYKHREKTGIKVKLPFFTKLKYNILGFSDFHYIAYDLKNNDYRKYINTRERNRLEDVNGRFAFFLGEKVMFERVFGNFVHVPHILCWVKNGKLIDLNNNDSEVSIIEILKDKKNLIAKPTRSVGGGKGVHWLSYNNDSFFVDGAEVSKSEMNEKVRCMEEYIITPKIVSHKYAYDIFPDSTNTIRVVTTMDNVTNEAELIFAFQRFGTKKSMPVDNFSSGGIFALIDNDTGKMSEARSLFELDKSFSVHPDTQMQIEGIQIPDWDNLKHELKKAHKCFPYYKFFAWDVAVDENNIPYILEVNRGSDLDVQIIKPLRDTKLGEFMRAEGLLDAF